MDLREFLLSYGTTGEFGRFRPARPMLCRRGDRAVVRSHRGLELGKVLCEATPGHARYLPNTSVGQLLRLATAQDEQALRQMQERGQRLFEDARRLKLEFQLPLELLDVEVLLDGRQAVIHHVRWADCDVRPFVSAISRAYEVQVALHDLGRSEAAEEHEEEAGEHGCGRPDCGRAPGGGGCSTCGTGGGCSSCGTGAPKDMKAYFATLREQMMARDRTPLL